MREAALYWQKLIKRAFKSTFAVRSCELLQLNNKQKFKTFGPLCVGGMTIMSSLIGVLGFSQSARSAASSAGNFTL